MKKQNDGGPAFPHNMPPEHPFGETGMKLRDWFAGQALSAMGEIICEPDSPEDLIARPGIVAKWAYAYADAMLSERAKGGEA